MNDHLRGILVNISALPKMFLLYLSRPCSFIHSARNRYSCTCYALDLFFGDPAFNPSKVGSRRRVREPRQRQYQ
jgi:hypothetical protein